MRCSLGCGEALNPSIGVANLVGKPGTPVALHKSVVQLCKYHYQQLCSGEWGNVTMVGWEEFPFVKAEEAK